MKLLTKNAIERIMWKIGSQTTREMSLHAERFNREQPLLASFVTAFTMELPPQGRDLTLYLAYLIWRIFETSESGAAPVSANIILEQIRENWLFIERFVDTRRNAGGYLTELDFLSQPHILDYIASLILEEARNAGIAEHHVGYMIFVLKTVLDSLDAAGNESL
jgi:hypothetical protein